jgi:hypothetical protein
VNDSRQENLLIESKAPQLLIEITPSQGLPQRKERRLPHDGLTKELTRGKTNVTDFDGIKHNEQLLSRS